MRGTPRKVWPPEPGLFRLRLVARGWQVPAQISLAPDGTWQAFIDETAVGPGSFDPASAPGVAQIWHGGDPIEPFHYDWLVATKRQAARLDPGHPALHPRRPIDPANLRPYMPPPRGAQ